MTDTDLSAYRERFRAFVLLREERDIKARAAEKAEADYREAEAELYQALTDAGIRGRQTFDFGGDIGTVSFQTRSTKFGRIIDKDLAIKSLREEGLDDAVYETAIRKKRLNELVRDRLESHDDLPEGVDFYESKGITVSRKNS